MAHRAEPARNAPCAPIVPVDLARWMLGLAWAAIAALIDFPNLTDELKSFPSMR